MDMWILTHCIFAQAEEEFNIEKVRIVQTEKKAIMKVTERKAKQAEVEEKMYVAMLISYWIMGFMRELGRVCIVALGRCVSTVQRSECCCFLVFYLNVELSHLTHCLQRTVEPVKCGTPEVVEGSRRTSNSHFCKDCRAALCNCRRQVKVCEDLRRSASSGMIRWRCVGEDHFKIGPFKIPFSHVYFPFTVIVYLYHIVQN